MELDRKGWKGGGRGGVGQLALLLVEILCRHLHKNNLHFETSLGSRKRGESHVSLGVCNTYPFQLHPPPPPFSLPHSQPPAMASKNSAEQLKLNQKQNQHFEPQVNESDASFSFSPSFATPPTTPPCLGPILYCRRSVLAAHKSREIILHSTSGVKSNSNV